MKNIAKRISKHFRNNLTTNIIIGLIGFVIAYIPFFDPCEYGICTGYYPCEVYGSDFCGGSLFITKNHPQFKNKYAFFYGCQETEQNTAYYESISEPDSLGFGEHGTRLHYSYLHIFMVSLGIIIFVVCFINIGVLIYKKHTLLLCF